VTGNEYNNLEVHFQVKDGEEAKTQFQSLVKAAPDSEFGLKAQKRLNDLKQMK